MTIIFVIKFRCNRIEIVGEVAFWNLGSHVNDNEKKKKKNRKQGVHGLGLLLKFGRSMWSWGHLLDLLKNTW